MYFSEGSKQRLKLDFEIRRRPSVPELREFLDSISNIYNILLAVDMLYLPHPDDIRYSGTGRRRKPKTFGRRMELETWLREELDEYLQLNQFIKLRLIDIFREFEQELSDGERLMAGNIHICTVGIFSVIGLADVIRQISVLSENYLNADAHKIRTRSQIIQTITQLTYQLAQQRYESAQQLDQVIDQLVLLLIDQVLRAASCDNVIYRK
jgi:hypothetical protein